MNTELEKEIRKSLIDGQLPYKSVLKISKELKVTLPEIGQTVAQLGITISDLQVPGPYMNQWMPFSSTTEKGSR